MSAVGDGETGRLRVAVPGLPVRRIIVRIREIALPPMEESALLRSFFR
jgi:hypothetical protein